MPNYYTETKSLLVAPCLICGKAVNVPTLYSGQVVCDECKQAIAWAKEKMKEKE